MQIAVNFISQFSDQAATVWPERTAFIAGSQRWSFAELQQRIAKTLTLISAFTPAQLDGSAVKEIVLRPGTPKEKKLVVEDYALKYGMPQFFFHVTTAYNLLRSNGVEIGK